ANVFPPDLVVDDTEEDGLAVLGGCQLVQTSPTHSGRICGLKPTHSRHHVQTPLKPHGGVSTNLLHGFGRFNLQNASRRGGSRCRGSADHLSRLEEEG